MINFTFMDRPYYPSPLVKIPEDPPSDGEPQEQDLPDPKDDV